MPSLSVSAVFSGVADLKKAFAEADLAAKAGQDYEAFLATRVAENPAGRFGTPDEFGKACAFLCSADAGFIIGQNLVIDGGSVNATI